MWHLLGWVIPWKRKKKHFKYFLNKRNGLFICVGYSYTAYCPVILLCVLTPAVGSTLSLCSRKFSSFNLFCLRREFFFIPSSRVTSVYFSIQIICALEFARVETGHVLGIMKMYTYGTYIWIINMEILRMLNAISKCYKVSVC